MEHVEYAERATVIDRGPTSHELKNPFRNVLVPGWVCKPTSAWQIDGIERCITVAGNLFGDIFVKC